MLTHLQLKDLVIVDEAELDFGPGLTALTGETGAGKSIVVDALLLIAGGRGAADIVRQGAERAEVAASFAALPDAAIAWLEAQAIEYNGEVIVRRVIGVDGRSRAYVNGQLVPIQQLREFAEFLIEVHGQQEFQHLVKRGAQREMLDEHLDQATLPGVVAEIHDRFRACRRDYDSLQLAANDRESRHDLLARASAALRAVADADPQLAQPMQLLAEATILADEAGGALRRYLDDLDVDPGRQEEIERHAAAIEALARKHRRTVLELPAQLVGTEEELRTLENAEFKLAELERRLALLESEFRAAALRLTQSRQRAAAELGREITDLMQTLGMAGGRFVVSVQPSETDIGPHGLDDIEFLVSANPGQPPKSLAKVASGGELSRISLAVQVAGGGT